MTDTFSWLFPDLQAFDAGQPAYRILESWDTEPGPHARAMIDFARQQGIIATPRNRAAGFAVHGLVRLLRLCRRCGAIWTRWACDPPAATSAGCS